ncbi:MAG TPA: hypothetical protein VJV78_16435 [Polyangiales bacterium]|nr:hypothetical protein [Polyangiales bacterium]
MPKKLYPMWWFGCALFAVSCAASQPATRTPTPVATQASVPVAAPPGELRMRHPDEVRASAAKTEELGSLQLVNAGTPRATKAKPKPSQPTAAHSKEHYTIQIAQDSPPRPYPLRDRELTLPSGLIIHGVPKSVSVQTVRERAGGDVWEITDARGRRLALLKAQSLSRKLWTTSARSDQLASARSVGQRSDWGAPRVNVVSERYLSENYVYTIERRTEGTGWIASGLEFTANARR